MGSNYSLFKEAIYTNRYEDIIILDDFLITTTDERSSKGYARKYLKNGYWYKQSAGAFNAQAEVICSRILAKMRIVPFVIYSLCRVNNNYASKSADFRKGKTLVTLNELYLLHMGISLFKEYSDLRNRRIEFQYKAAAEIIRFVEGLGVPGFKDWLSLLFQFDAFILNEDRHWNNIGFLVNLDGSIECSPFFDFDCSLFSTLEDLDRLNEYVDAAPCHPFFEKHAEQMAFAFGLSNRRLPSAVFHEDQLLSDLWDPSFNIGKREIIWYLKRQGVIVD